MHVCTLLMLGVWLLLSFYFSYYDCFVLILFFVPHTLMTSTPGITKSAAMNISLLVQEILLGMNLAEELLSHWTNEY